ncbi:MAG: carbamoyl-phosphate synthase large subunit [Actinobacteria bacterium]|nr:MAG: carbamoyl-phosphate synthase large subunit [Actinomycetota bacterium]
MPRRDDIRKILVIGSGPIVIGQACEFDYSGAQACKVLREDGYEVVLVNSNPATIMTDPEMAHRTYVEPVTPEFVAKVIERERPDALLPTLGGQTGLNCAVALADAGILDEYGVELIGADRDAIKKGEDRKLFAEAMARIGLDVPRSAYAYTVGDAEEAARGLGFPLVVRPSFTMGGAGGGIAYNLEDLREVVAAGVALSPIGEVLVEESVIGWKEYEMEVMRDRNDNAVIVCSIENFDAMGVHTGDSITVAPAQTLTDREYQVMRDASIAILREIGVETGGSNVQFAVNPADGRLTVIEMNPRVSRSSALASKATGFPIAKIAAKLAVGYTLDEIPNDITEKTPACFEPSIDYCVVKVPRWAFEKFRGTDETLTTRMKSVGEAMAIGRTFEEALGKAMRSLENGRGGLGADGKDAFDETHFEHRLSTPNEQRAFYLAEALRRGRDAGELHEITRIDPWFIDRMRRAVAVEAEVAATAPHDIDEPLMRRAKQAGISDVQIAHLTRSTPAEARAWRLGLGVKATFKAVDTCAAEFEAYTPYYYKTYETEDEVRGTDKPRAMILGAGPNRIGQGIEFDYCCVHAAYALRDLGYETIMVNCNPETVSTDYDTSDVLFFEPLTFEDVMDIVEATGPAGVVVTFGGQTPLKLAHALEAAGVPIMGTKPEAIDLAEDRERFQALLDRLGIAYPAAGTARTHDEALEVARRIGFPLLVRPSYVLGGRGMVIAYSEDYLERYMDEATSVSPDHPVLLDRFLEGAVEVDVDCVADGETVYVGGVMEHIEEAGIHSGDSACCIPPFTLSDAVVEQIRSHTRTLALELGVCGLMNVQYAVKDSAVYVLEVNPRASRTVPFVSKATGVPLAKVAARVMAGEKLAGMHLPDELRELGRFCVKEAVMPFGRFPGADSVLGPEMKSTGEVMGVAEDFPAAYAKSQLAIDYSLPASGAAFISVADRDKREIVGVAKHLETLGFELLATRGTARALKAAGIPVTEVRKVHEGRPNIVDAMKSGEVSLVINTPFGQETRSDGYHIRSAAIAHGVTNITTVQAAQAAVHAIEAAARGRLGVIALQDFNGQGGAS